jgi:intracellular multiplication protein IcmP
MPAKGSPPPQQQGNEGSMDLLWITVLIVAVALLLWYVGKNYIAHAVFFVKYYEIIAIKFVITFWDKIAHFFGLPIVSTRSLDEWLFYITTHAGDYRDATFSALVNVHTDVGKYLRFPIAIILAASALILYSSAATTKFKNVFSMSQLRDVEKDDWPRIRPVLNLKLVEEDINSGLWAMATTPMQFGKRHALLKEETKDGKPIVKIIRGKAYDVFALQLGALWNGNLNALRPHIKALLAIFAARIDRNIEAADKLLDQIALSSATGHPNFSGSRELLAKHIRCKEVIKVLQHHAYVTTMMASMLDVSRTVGVMATADFIWLKPLDRKLWYVLNSVGRQTSAPEASGVFSHWLAERKMVRPLRVPMVENAIQGLDEAIQDILYEPSEEQ